MSHDTGKESQLCHLAGGWQDWQTAHQSFDFKSILHFAGKSRGYAFIEFEHKNDMKTAYKMADGKRIEGKRVVVDVERGRTVPNW